MTEDVAARFVPCSGASWRTPWPMYAASADRDPVHHVESGDYWVLSRFTDVFAARAGHHDLLVGPGPHLRIRRDGQGGSGRGPADGDDGPPGAHRVPAPGGRGFTPRHVTEIEPAVRAFVVERIERLRVSGRGDVVAEVFKPLPSFVVAYYLGVPETDWPRFDGWTEGIVAANAEVDAQGREHRRRALRLLQRPDRTEAGGPRRRHHLRAVHTAPTT